MIVKYFMTCQQDRSCCTKCTMDTFKYLDNKNTTDYPLKYLDNKYIAVLGVITY